MALGTELAGQVCVITIYIAEAHACEEWPVGDEHNDGACSMSQAKTLGGRREAARHFARELAWPFEIYVDSMEDTFESTFAAWPVRFFIIHTDGATIAHVAYPEPEQHTYSIDRLRSALEATLSAK